MVRSDGDPLQVIPMKIASESPPPGERLRQPKKSAMNSRLPKQTISPREKSPYIRRSLIVETMSMDE
jgi:hypothetical protein